MDNTTTVNSGREKKPVRAIKEKGVGGLSRPPLFLLRGLEAVPQRELHAVIRRYVVGAERLHARVELVDTLRSLLSPARQVISSLSEERGGAADRTAGVVLIREPLDAPLLVEQVREVNHVEAQLQVLL